MAKLAVGINDLETYCKTHGLEYLLDEFDYDKNAPLMPKDFSYGSKKEIYWKCKKCNTSFSKKIKERTLWKMGCKNCKSHKKTAKKNKALFTSKHNFYQTSFPEQAIFFYIKQYFSDAIHRHTDFGMELDIYIPSIKTAIEYDGVLFHQKTDRETKKNQLCKDNDIKLIRIREEGLCSYDDCICITRKNIFDRCSINNTIEKMLLYLDVKNINIDISKDYIAILESYHTVKVQNSLATKFPEIAKEWHPTKNGNLKPEHFSCHSNEYVWWECEHGHEWNTQINARTGCGKTNCPKCFKRQQIRIVRCVETGVVYNSITEAHLKTNINMTSISLCCKGKQHTAGGYHWEYVF